MKEFMKKIYLMWLKFISLFIFAKEQKNNVLFINQFPHTMDSIIYNVGPEYKKVIVDPLKTKNLKMIKLIKQASFIFADNYNVLLSITNTKNKTVVQTWHAGGAIKKIGFDSNEIKSHSKGRKKRYQKVYDSFDFYITANKHMDDVITKSFNQPEDKLLRLGYPKIDLYARKQFMENVDQIRNQNFDKFLKKTVLYCPTFRDTKEDNLKQIEFLEKLENSLVKEQYNIFYKLHPSLKNDKELKERLNNIDYAIEIEEDLEYFYPLANLLITDYSSVLFEYLLFNQNVMLYVYDEDKYKDERGLNVLLGDLSYNVYKDDEELIGDIRRDTFHQANQLLENPEFAFYNEKFVGRKIVQLILNDE